MTACRRGREGHRYERLQTSRRRLHHSFMIDADAMKSVGHGALQAPWFCRPADSPIVLPGEADLAVVEPDQVAVGDGDAVGLR
jgi:hypothetical protein